MVFQAQEIKVSTTEAPFNIGAFFWAKLLNFNIGKGTIFICFFFVEI